MVVRSLTVAIMSFALFGCANQAANMHVGSDMTYISLKDQREAVMVVKEYKEIPEGAVSIGEVLAARCHRNTLDAPPKDSDVVIDLKVVAYAKGADGITAISIEKESGLLKNCWAIYNGKAMAFTLKK